MAETSIDRFTRTCKCLNVRIRPQSHVEKPPEFLISTAEDPDYTLTYVGNQGLSIVHPQVTMRTRKMGPPIADSSRCIRFTTLTCLLCQTLAYRVRQLVASDVDRQEGPLLPSSDWVEQETLLSSCGWIEVHKDCLPAENATQLSSASTYSPVFDIVIPQNAVPTIPTTQPGRDTTQESCAEASPLGPFLSSLRPLFPPAPFVPSHPVFSHLSSIAAKASEQLRSAAEEQIAAIVRDKLLELTIADNKLRGNVEDIWRNFVENIGEVEKQIGGRLGDSRRRDSSRGLSIATSGTSGTPIVSVRNFVPTPNPALRLMSPTSLPRVSSLSASLATSGIHFSHADQGSSAREPTSDNSPQSPPPYSSHPSSLSSAGSLSSSVESSPVIPPRIKGDKFVQPFKRDMDETRDTIVSFRYFTILEADVARAHEQNTRSERSPESNGPVQESGDLKTAKVTSGPSAKDSDGGAEKQRLSPIADQYVKSLDGTPRSKRKVKFDIKAQALVGEDGSAEAIAKAQGGEELIFDLEDGSADTESSDAAPVLPFIESVQAPLRRGRQRVSGHGVLPASLSSLRPTSLPVYSPLHVKDSDEPASRQPDSEGSHPTSPILLQTGSEYREEHDPQEEEILKLVAANTPSHRGAWKRNSKAWQQFVSKRPSGPAGALVAEEVEDGHRRVTDDTDDSDLDGPRDARWSHSHAGFPASLPINIGPLSRRREPLSLASYRPKSTLSDRQGTIVSTLPDGKRRTSSATLRKASYAERDRSRAMDPGTLDFTTEDGEDEEADESEEEPSKLDPLDEGRGRQRALKILEARSKIPEAGMWMSLA